MAQLMRPDADITTTNWSTAPLWSKIDEVTPSDADLITALASSTATAECSLSDPAATPTVDTGHIVRARIRASKTNKAAILTVSLYQGATPIRAVAYDAEVDLTTSFAEYSFTLTEGEAGNITNYNDLRLRFAQTTATGGNFTEVSWAEFEIPDGASAVTKTTSLGALLFGTAELTASADAGLATVGILRTASIDATLIPKPELIWDEQFENAAGYDETWSEGETIGTGPILDENFSTAGIGAAPAGWGDRCLRLVTVGGEDSYVLHRGWGGGADGIPISYTRLEVIVDEESLANSEGIHFLSTRDSENEKFYQYILYQSGSGVLKIEAQIWYDGGSSNFESIEIDLDTLYRLEMKWDITNEAWEWRVNGETIASGAISGEGLNRPLDGVFIGDIAAQNDAAVTIYLDNFAVNNTEWVGGASTQTKTTSLAAALLRQKILRTASADAGLRATFTRTTDLAALLAAHVHISTDLAAVLQQLQAATTQADAAVRAAIAVSTDLDARISLGVTTQTVTADLDGVLAELMAAQASVDAAVAALVSRSTDLGAALSATGMAQSDIDAVLAALFNRTTALGAALAAPGTLTTDTDAAVLQSLIRTADFDARLVIAGVTAVYADTDAAVQQVQLAQMVVDAALALVTLRTTDLDARISIAAATQTAQSDFDAALSALLFITATADAAVLRQGVTGTAELDARLNAAVSISPTTPGRTVYTTARAGMAIKPHGRLLTVE